MNENEKCFYLGCKKNATNVVKISGKPLCYYCKNMQELSRTFWNLVKMILNNQKSYIVYYNTFRKCYIVYYKWCNNENK